MGEVPGPCPLMKPLNTLPKIRVKKFFFITLCKNYQNDSSNNIEILIHDQFLDLLVQFLFAASREPDYSTSL